MEDVSVWREWHCCALEREREGAVDGIDVVVVVCRRSEIEGGLGLVDRRRPFRRYRQRGSSVVQILICDNSSPRSFTAMFRARTQLHRQRRCTQFPAPQPYFPPLDPAICYSDFRFTSSALQICSFLKAMPVSSIVSVHSFLR